MTAALIILISLLAVGALVYLLDNKKIRTPEGASKSSAAESSDPKSREIPHSSDKSDRSDPSDHSDPSDPSDLPGRPGDDSGICCGMHITCEKDSLSTAAATEILYYDDEELDIYATRSGNDYTEAETEQFRDILLTLLPADIAGWARSLQLRHIPLPPAVTDELLLIVTEARAAK